MLTYTKGNIFNSEMETLVNPVNVKGVMGAGLAKQFKTHFGNEYFKEYVHDCSLGNLSIGNLSVYYEDEVPKVLNFPTKIDWRDPSEINYIESGLKWIRENYKEYHIKSLAIPPLGCGLGGLSKSKIIPIIERTLRDLDDLDIEIYI